MASPMLCSFLPSARGEALGGLSSSRTELQQLSTSRPWAEAQNGIAGKAGPHLLAPCLVQDTPQEAAGCVPLSPASVGLAFPSGVYKRFWGKQKVMVVPQGQGTRQNPHAQRLLRAHWLQRGLSHFF